VARTDLPGVPVLEKHVLSAHPGSSPLTRAERPHRKGIPIARNQRAHLELPVVVHGHSPNKEPLRELTRTLVVYAHGALVTLNATVEPGQELVLVNAKTNVEAACRVAGFEPDKNGYQSLVRVEFTRPAARFWGVVFPPENWNPAERKLPRTLRHHSRVKCSEPVRIRSAEDSSNHFDDVCITQNISRDGLYFTSEHSAYREGMRLVINFLYHVQFSAPHTDYLGQVVRVDESKDGGVGVAVKLSEPIAWQKAHDRPGRVVVFRQKTIHQRIVKAVPETTAVATVPQIEGQPNIAGQIEKLERTGGRAGFACIFPGAKVRGQLKEAISLRRVQEIASDICRRARRRSALGAEWANELGRIFYSHASKLLRLKWAL